MFAAACYPWSISPPFSMPRSSRSLRERRVLVVEQGDIQWPGRRQRLGMQYFAKTSRDPEGARQRSPFVSAVTSVMRRSGKVSPPIWWKTNAFLMLHSGKGGTGRNITLTV